MINRLLSSQGRNGEALANCPACDSAVGEILYSVPSVPIHSCVLLDSAEQALQFPRRELELAFCGACGLIFNRAFDESVMHYSTSFEESQHFSATFSSFAKKLAKEIAERCEISGKLVVEIGCGKGEFLSELCDISGATGIGIDPGYRADSGRLPNAGKVRFINDLFGSRYYGLRADVILCRHTLEHISAVGPFVRSIREMVGSRDNVWIVFETPDAKRVLRECAFWDIYYEHCSYFSPGAHARLFRQESFDVTDISLAFDEQYIVQYARPAKARTTARFALEQDLEELRKLAADFATAVIRIRDAWHARLRSEYGRGRRVVLWGGGSKAVSFLTTLGIDREVAAAVDINPYKQGKYIPGTAHPVVAPQSLVACPPDLVIVMNPIYRSEVARQLKDLGLTPEIITV